MHSSTANAAFLAYLLAWEAYVRPLFLAFHGLPEPLERPPPNAGGGTR